MDPEDDGKPKIPQARRTADFMPPARERRYVFDKAFDAHLDNRALYTSTVKVCWRCTPPLSRCAGAVHQHCQGVPALSVLVPTISRLESAVVQSECNGTASMSKEVVRQRRCRRSSTAACSHVDDCALSLRTVRVCICNHWHGIQRC